MRRIAVVPDVLALRTEYASLVDPVAELRAVVDAVVADADHVVRLNGSARRTSTSPGPYDERAMPFDEALFAALTEPDVTALRSLDAALAAELWADVTAAGELADLLAGNQWDVKVKYDDAPFGVAWWVIAYENTGR